MTCEGPAAPGPGMLHAVAAGLDFQRYLRWRRARTGDPFVVGFPGFGAVVFTGSSAGAREVFRLPAHAVRPPRPNPIEPMVGPGSLILAAGERHRADRALLTPVLRAVGPRGYAELIRTAAAAEVARWRPGTRIDARAAARAVALRVILTVVFGADDEVRHATYRAAVTDFLTAFSGPLLLVPALRRGCGGRAPWDRFLAARTRLDALIRADVVRRRTRGPSGDLLAALIAAGRTDDELCDQLRTLLVAGHETTATSLVWALYHLHRTPGTLDRVRGEPAWLDAACQETLRLHPPVPIVLRRLCEPRTLFGTPLAAGDTVGVAVPLLHSQPELWPDPWRFRPERFRERGYGPFEFAPYGGGHRRCPGAALAELELRVVLDTVLGAARLRLTPRYRYGPAPRAVPHNIATGPWRGISFTTIG
ncbi:cytochrome P450 [Nocardia farcinica]